jgi:hypothetical protein
VKYYTEDKLAETDLKQLKRSSTQILRKEFKTIKMIAEYFKFPKIILAILLAFLAFKASFILMNQ